MSISSTKNWNMCKGFDIFCPESQFIARDTAKEMYDV
jgi:hypothetical protein